MTFIVGDRCETCGVDVALHDYDTALECAEPIIEGLRMLGQDELACALEVDPLPALRGIEIEFTTVAGPRTAFVTSEIDGLPLE